MRPEPGRGGRGDRRGRERGPAEQWASRARACWRGAPTAAPARGLRAPAVRATAGSLRVRGAERRAPPASRLRAGARRAGDIQSIITAECSAGEIESLSEEINQEESTRVRSRAAVDGPGSPDHPSE